MGGMAATELPLTGSISYKGCIWTCLLKKLQAVLGRIMRPSASSGPGEPFKTSTPLLQTLAWGSSGEANIPELPWSCSVCLKEGVTALVLWIVIVEA